MIIYDLTCEHEHRFEGWFHNPQDFSDQLERGLVICPQCGSPSIHKLPSAISISRNLQEGKAVGSGPIASAPAVNSNAPTPPVTPTQAMAIYRQFAKAVATLSDDVGSSFAEEARRMHYNEIPERMIRGQTTDDELAELDEEGIAVMRLPVFKEEDLN